MKRLFVRFVVPGVLLVGLGMTGSLLAQKPEPARPTPGAPSPTYPAAASHAPDAAIAQLAKSYESAFNKGDVKALVALYTGDAWRLTPTGTFLSGKAAIEQDYTAAMAGPFKGSTLTLHPGKTQMVSADVALIEGTYEVATSGAPAKGHYMNTIVRQSGQWRLAGVVTVPDAPPTAR